MQAQVSKVEYHIKNESNHMKHNDTEQMGSDDPKGVALHYMKTLVEVARESFLILDSSIRVISANPTFYENFQVTQKETEGKPLYELGNGQWNIPELRRLLEDILPDKKVIKNYEVKHNFEAIGEKTILLNARQIDTVQLIILAMEDISVRKQLEKKIAEHAEELTCQVAERTGKLAEQVKELEALNKTMVGRELKMVELKEEIENLKKKIKNGNGKNGKNGKNGNGNHKN